MQPFAMPRPYVGQTVLWWPDAEPGASEARPAIVVSVGERTVCLAGIEKDAYGFAPSDSVRHRDDPTLRNPEARTGGCWDWTEFEREMAQVKHALGNLLQ